MSDLNIMIDIAIKQWMSYIQEGEENGSIRIKNNYNDFVSELVSHTLKRYEIPLEKINERVEIMTNKKNLC